MGCSMLARYSLAQHPPLTFEMLCGLEFRGPPSPSEQERMRAWKASQADFAFCLELVLE